jgi:hypothetical protein
VSTATPTARQASFPSRAALRWCQLAIIVLGLALTAVTATAIYLTVNHSTATSATVHTGPVTEQACWQSQVLC